MNLTYSKAFLHLARLFYLIEGHFSQINAERTNTDRSKYFTLSNILAPIQSCQLKLLIMSQKFPDLALQIILQLSKSETPFESLDDLPNLRVHHHARRYRDHCRVQIAFSPSLHIQVWAAGSLQGHTSRMNREREIVIFMAEYHPPQLIGFEYDEWLCSRPLNVIVLLYMRVRNGSLFWIHQVVVSQRCKGGQLTCSAPDDFLLGNGKSSVPVQSYDGIMQHFHKARLDFHGTRLYHYNAPGSRHLDDVKVFDTLGAFRHSHCDAVLAGLQISILLGRQLNFSLTAFSHTIVNHDQVKFYCQLGAFSDAESYALSDAAEGSPINIFLNYLSYFRAFYTEDDGDLLSPMPFKLKSLMVPVDSAIWLLLFLAIAMMSAFMIVKLLGQDATGVILTVLSSLTAHAFSCRQVADSRLKLWLSLWILLTTFLSMQYTNSTFL